MGRMREFRLAFRTLAKTPAFLTLAVATFTLGIGAATVLFSVTESVLLVSFFASLAVLLAGVGVYGAISFAAAQRTREFGLRIALGAGKRAIMTMTLARTGRLALAGAGCGLALALLLGSLVRSALYLVPGQHGGVLFGVGIHDPVSLAAAAFLMLALAGLAALAPAVRAARVEPMTALRHEG